MGQSSLVDALAEEYEIQIRAHLATLGPRVNDDKIKQEISAVMSDLSKLIRQALVEAIGHRTKIETEFGAYEGCAAACQRLSYKCSGQRSHSDDYYELDDDEIMINESTDEFNTETLSELQDQLNNLDQFEDGLSILISQPLLLNDVENKIQHGEEIRQRIFDRISGTDINNNSPLIISTGISSMNHTSFVMNTNMKVSDNSLFKANADSFVEIECDDASSRAGGFQLFDHLKFELINVDACSQVEIRVKEKTRRDRRLIRAYFRASAGIHRLSIQFDQVDMPGSPFLFVVFPEPLISPEFKVPSVPTRVITKQEIRCEDLNVSMTSNASDSNASLASSNACVRSTVMRGRGKMLRSMLSGPLSAGSPLTTPTNPIASRLEFPSTPSNRYDDADDDNYDDQMQQEPEIKAKVPMREIEYVSMPVFKITNQRCLISEHLKRHGVGEKQRLFADSLPNIQAVFMCKYENLEFPIGVRACERRNWVVVCESGINQVKIFERSSGTLLFTLKGTNPTYFTLKRPSAALIDDNELYIKDDKEILVFDMDKDFRLIRKFGSNILRRPYGLSFSPQGHLMLVDADIRSQPSLVMFDKHSGELVASRPFHPGLKERAASNVLLERHNVNNRLGDQIQPFEKTKLRFIYASNESFYVSDLGRTVVYETDLNGNIKMAFGRFGKRRNEMIEPSGLHVESDGNAIVVGDSKNDRIQVFNSIILLLLKV